MRSVFTVFSLLLLGFTADAQKITGIWRGYFSSSNNISREGREEMYKYELQISQQSNNSVKGVTYSYKSTIFYGKAEVTGIFTASTKSLLIRETKLVDLKVAGQSEPCLMTCYLDYSKMGKMEFLQGTFISINAKDKGDCGSGKVYLEKVTTSDFKKEDFLEKTKDIDTVKHIDDLAKSHPPKPQPAKPPVKQQPGITPPVTNKPSVAKPLAGNRPHTEKTKPKPQADFVERVPEVSVNSPRNVDTPPAPKQEHPIRKMPLPKVLTDRENNLVKTIIVDEEDVQIDFFDNGTIDNDTISVYDNNSLVVSKSRLTYTPITIRLKMTKTDNRHEIIVVADNLGEYPPNTALMVINGRTRKRQEVFLASNEERNAKVIIEYRPKE